MSRASDVQLRFKRQAADVPAPSDAGVVALEVVDSGGNPELRMVDESAGVWVIGSGGGGSNLDGGSATSTYGGTTALDGGNA